MSAGIIQLEIELQDLLFGRRNGSLLQARDATKNIGEQDHMFSGLLNVFSQVEITPFQQFFGSLADAAHRLDVENDLYQSPLIRNSAPNRAIQWT